VERPGGISGRRRPQDVPGRVGMSDRLDFAGFARLMKSQRAERIEFHLEDWQDVTDESHGFRDLTFSEIEAEVRAYFNENPNKEIYPDELADILKVDPVPVFIICKKLCEEKKIEVA
jgi:hypothetical protein